MSDHVLVSFLKKFDRYPFCVKSNQEEYRIGEGEPEFTVNFKRPVSLQALLTSTSLALGEAYMDGSLEIEGNLYHALNCFLGQMGAFSTDKIALKKIMYTSGYFCSEIDTLEQAQVNKVDYVLDKLNLEKGMYLLDIGCGWGFLLIEAAKKYGVRGLRITALQQDAFMPEQEFSGAPRRGGGNVRRAVRADVGIVPLLLRGHLHKWNH